MALAAATGAHFMREIMTGTYASDELFDTNVKQAFSRFTTLRYLTANFNEEQNWSDRKLPGRNETLGRAAALTATGPVPIPPRDRKLRHCPVV